MKQLEMTLFMILFFLTVIVLDLDASSNLICMTQEIGGETSKIVFYHEVHQDVVEYKSETRFHVNITCNLPCSIDSMVLYYRKKNEQQWNKRDLDSIQSHEYLAILSDQYYCIDDTIEYFLTTKITVLNKYENKTTNLFHPVLAPKSYHTFWFNKKTSITKCNSESVKIYPNPATDFIKISNIHTLLNLKLGKESTLSVANCVGDIFYKRILSLGHSESEDLLLDLSNLFPGTYYLLIETEEKSIGKIFSVVR